MSDYISRMSKFVVGDLESVIADRNLSNEARVPDLAVFRAGSGGTKQFKSI